ncbi:MAG: polynucleotide kinase-phosphatase [Planctomycetes bacterium]|nr:polynucleotide kinase-phosphatase [Planctomycetota bacterium]
MATIQLPDLSLVVLVGASGSGKSTFAAAHFAGTEVLSSDRMRGWVDDDENSLEATPDAFDALHHLAALRLKRGRLTVIDATNVRREDRQPLVALAHRYHAIPVAIVFKTDPRLCEDRNRQRADRQMGPHVVRNHTTAVRKSLHSLKREGFRHVFVLETPDEVAAVAIARQPLWSRSHYDDCGPFDIIGDVHGCANELEELLDRLGYERAENGGYRHAAGRKAVFVGDLVDRGPRVVDTVRIVHAMCAAGAAYCVPGNHDIKLMRKLRGKDVQITHGLAESLKDIDRLPPDEKDHFSKQYIEFVDALVSHQVLDGGRLVVAHAGMAEELQGRGSAKVREFALYGDTTGETDEFGLPIRLNWAEQYRGRASVVYGHVAVPEAQWLNNTIDIDTGCAFGGKLTALRWPERELVAVAARSVYAEPARPLYPPAPDLSLQQQHDDLLDIADFIGKRFITTPLSGNVTIHAEHAAAALEVMSRFAVDPRWLLYLPPTMSPCETSSLPQYLEHPAEALAYYRNQGIPRVVCQEKHMGSRAVVVVCRNEATAGARFGVDDGTCGVCYTRTGRRFFESSALQQEFMRRLQDAIGQAGLWDALESDWLCLDCELMPWNAKARQLLIDQYAPVAVAGRVATTAALGTVEQTIARGIELGTIRERLAQSSNDIADYSRAYGHYCWAVEGLEGVRLAPFHLLASEGQVHADKDHRWHMNTLARLAEVQPDWLVATPWREVDLLSEQEIDAATDWWSQQTAAGGEGMVVKPHSFIARGPRGLVQPAVKCRGREYLRIIYGPDYTRTENLARLKNRGLGHKRSMAQREFALGLEALERFVRHEPLRRVHECVFGVLALESEPVDPRL